MGPIDCLAADFRDHGLGFSRAGFRAEAAALIAAFPDLGITLRRLVTDTLGTASPGQ